MIYLENVSVTYKGHNRPRLVVDQLELRQGQCLVLCGRNGSGKTTLTRLLNGLFPEYYEGELAGQASIVGLTPGKHSLEEFSQQVASVFQNPATQFFHRKVKDELVFPCENQGLKREEIQQRLDRTVFFFGLESLLEQDLITASGGQRQRIALATAYMQNPKLLILDEPSAHLDQAGINLLEEHLKRLKASGVSIVIAEHRMDYVREFADQYAYFDQGYLKKQWSKSEWIALSDEERHKLGLRALISFVERSDESMKEQDDMLLKNIDITVGNKCLGILDYLGFSEGAITAITGPNGLGKTSLAKIMAGLSKTSGDIFYHEQSLSLKTRLKQHAYVMQDTHHQLFSDSVRKELVLGNANTENLIDMARQFQLSHLLECHPMSLSGGEQQRVLIANALLSSKEVFIFDEPTSGLDYDNMMALSNQLKCLKQKGKIVVIITHDREFIVNTCDNLIKLQNHFKNH